MNILLAITGSVASIKAEKIVASLSKKAEVKIIATQSAEHFYSNTKVLTDVDEWIWKEIGDPILHIDLKDWADVLLIAPLSANTLAKIAHGICDNLVTCVYRAWPINKRIVIAPAMNTDMWTHPCTQEHLTCLKNRHSSKLSILYPVEKKLACGIIGIGALANIDDIVKETIGID